MILGHEYEYAGEGRRDVRAMGERRVREHEGAVL